MPSRPSNVAIALLHSHYAVQTIGARHVAGYCIFLEPLPNGFSGVVDQGTAYQMMYVAARFTDGYSRTAEHHFVEILYRSLPAAYSMIPIHTCHSLTAVAFHINGIGIVSQSNYYV